MSTLPLLAAALPPSVPTQPADNPLPAHQEPCRVLTFLKVVAAFISSGALFIFAPFRGGWNDFWKWVYSQDEEAALAPTSKEELKDEEAALAPTSKEELKTVTLTEMPIGHPLARPSDQRDEILSKISQKFPSLRLKQKTVTEMLLTKSNGKMLSVFLFKEPIITGGNNKIQFAVFVDENSKTKCWVYRTSKKGSKPLSPIEIAQSQKSKTERATLKTRIVADQGLFSHFAPGGSVHNHIMHPARARTLDRMESAVKFLKAHRDFWTKTAVSPNNPQAIAVHRDIKLDNTLVTEKGDYKVTDLDDAIAIPAKDYNEKYYITCGTPFALPLEFWTKEPVNLLAPDFYALGMAILEIYLAGSVLDEHLFNSIIQDIAKKNVETEHADKSADDRRKIFYKKFLIHRNALEQTIDKATNLAHAQRPRLSKETIRADIAIPCALADPDIRKALLEIIVDVPVRALVEKLLTEYKTLKFDAVKEAIDGLDTENVLDDIEILERGV